MPRIPRLARHEWCGLSGAGLLAIWLALTLVFAGPNWSLWLFFISGVLLAGVWVFHEREMLLNASQSPMLRSGSNAMAFTAGVLGVIILLNVITTRHSYRKDLTANAFYSLSDQTIKTLKGLKQKVKVTAFFKAGDNQQLRDLLEEYRHYSTFLDFEFIDPDKTPARAQIFKVSSYNTTVVESGIKRKDIQPQEIFGYSFQGQQPQREFKGEMAVTAAIISVTSEKQQSIYFLEGHGERSPGDSGENGMAEMKRLLESDSYTVNTLNLIKDGKIPDDAGLIVIAGPHGVVSSTEVRLLRNWLDRNGRLLVLLDPESSGGLDELLAHCGVKVMNGIAVDPRSFYFVDPLTPIPTYGNHEITADLAKQRVGTLFPGARAFDQTESKALLVTPLLMTTPESWLERGTTTAQPKYDPKTDLKGPLKLAMAVSSLQRDSLQATPGMPAQLAGAVPKLVVFGDSDFCSNRIRSVSDGNFDIFLNSANWLLGSSGSISIRPKQPDARRLFMTNVQTSFLWYLCVLLTPLAVIGVGVWRWWRRRSL